MGINSYVPTQQSPECPVVPVPFALSCRRDRTCGERSRTKAKNKIFLLTNQNKMRYDNSIIVVYAGRVIYDNETTRSGEENEENLHFVYRGFPHKYQISLFLPKKC